MYRYVGQKESRNGRATYLQSFGRFRVFGRKPLTVSAPRGVELDYPYIVALEHVLGEIVVGEFDHFRVGRVNGHRTPGDGGQ